MHRAALSLFARSLATARASEQILPMSLSTLRPVRDVASCAARATRSYRGGASARLLVTALARRSHTGDVAFAPAFGRTDAKLNARGFSVVAEAGEGESDEGAAAEETSADSAQGLSDDLKVYIGNLPWDVTDETLKETFASFNVVEASVVTDRNSGRSRGYGFLHLADNELVDRCIEEMNGSQMGGRDLRVNRAMSPTEKANRPIRMEGGYRGSREANKRRVYFGNLSWGMDHLDLQDLCGEFGSVEDSRLITDRETGRSRGFGFVTMSSEAEANEVVTQLNGQDVDGRVLRVNIANSD